MTKHLNQRMSQRGISADMVTLASEYGEIDQDKFILGRKALDRLLGELDRLKRIALKARDKGGIVVVENGGAQITTYNRDSLKWRRH
ncbi:hypothetical protein [Parasphingorhabdus sp. NYA22]